MAKRQQVAVLKAQESVEVPRRKSKRRWIILAVVLVVLLALGAGGYLAARRMNGPAVGTVVTSLAPQRRQPPVELAQYDGTTFSFVHPMTYVLQQTKTPPNPVELETHSFVSTIMTGGFITTTVTKFPSGNLNDDTAYSTRAQDSKKYSRKVIVAQNEQVVIFTADDGQQLQQSAFWAHAGKLLTFSLTTGGGDTNTMSSEFLSMVESINWR